MFDIGSSELLLIVIVAVLVIGPKDLPRALYKVGKLVGQARGMAKHFRTGLDTMIREVELEEMEKKWAAENKRIMAEHPSPAPEPAATPDPQAPYVEAAPNAILSSDAPVPAAVDDVYSGDSYDPPASEIAPLVTPPATVAEPTPAEPAKPADDRSPQLPLGDPKI